MDPLNSISYELYLQVWSILMELLSDLPEEELKKLKVFAYDDMCHLKVAITKES